MYRLLRDSLMLILFTELFILTFINVLQNDTSIVVLRFVNTFIDKKDGYRQLNVRPLYALVTMAVSAAILEIFNVKGWPDLEIWVWDPLRSLKKARFDRPCMTSISPQL